MRKRLEEIMKLSQLEKDYPFNVLAPIKTGMKAVAEEVLEWLKEE